MTRLIPVLVLLVGCSILNRPDDPIDVGPRDAGPDGGDSMVDAPDPDTGDSDVPDKICNIQRADEDPDDEFVDCTDLDCDGRSCLEGAADESVCVCRRQRAIELDCGNDTDDDGDGTTDCNDLDCAQQQLAECCGGGMRPGFWPEDFCPTGDWETRGGGAAICDSADLVNFNHTSPVSIVWADCLSLALGATFTASFAPRGEGTCDADGRCEENVKLILAARDQPRESNGLFFPELAVVMHANGALDVTQGDTPIPGEIEPLTPLPAAGLHQVRIEIRPVISDTGEAELHARVVYLESGMTTENELWEGFLIALDELSTDNQCRDVPGLFLVVEGFKDRVLLTDLQARQTDCSNPSLFQPSDSILTPYNYGDGATSLELEPSSGADWATQALSAPTLLPEFDEFDANTVRRWSVSAEASNDQPSNEPSFRVGYAIAYRENSVWPDDRWIQGGRDTPWIGNQPPSCLDGSCSGEFSPDMPPYPSVREPFLFRTDRTTALIAFAGEVPVDGEPRSEKFGIYVASNSSFESSSTVAPDSLMLDPADVAECDSLRDPAVIHRPGGGPDNFWLFYTCFLDLASQGIFVIPLEVDTIEGLRVPPGATSSPVLVPSQLNFGRGTLRSAEVVLDDTDDVYTNATQDAVIAMWFLVGQEVGLAIGQGKEDWDTELEALGTRDVPILQLFEGNPVLTPDDRAFSRACSGCSIEGLAVSRTSSTNLRFLIARENDDEPARYDLLPLDQTWRNLARP